MTAPNIPLKVRLIILFFKILFLPFILFGLISKLLGFGPRSHDGIDGHLRLHFLTPAEKAYWEVWGTRDGGFMMHWGQLGERGEKRKYAKSQRDVVMQVLEQVQSKGFCEIDYDEMASFDVVWTIDGFGSKADRKKRDEVQELLNEELGWFGVGESSDMSRGSGEMEVGCQVVDAEIGQACIVKILKGTEFDDYVRIDRLGGE
jgi:hypothetical protein